MKGHSFMVQLLVANGADISATEKFGRTALHCAGMNGHELVAWLLLNKSKPDSVKNGRASRGAVRENSVIPEGR
ncbi:hypothetical protein FN846DRAFT_941785 [Sphaerosporella brunnea]|uniref:Uncharacterized protein n=1 Tax=Sphaerosporella brunnea TaxID=1250544 RepID=A0A5J5F0X0_9PEZI|nr:hypothetical protein FN846DRAFT_941785 [Sphaerosporella brunnea]